MTPAALVDEDVRRLITADGLDALLFVEAGAGTGKTSQLVARVVALVLRREVPMGEIAAVTFTEAAASELRARIRESFERCVHDTTTDAVDRARAEAALAEIDSAAIGTVHSFAQRILSEHPVEAGLPPSVEVLDEVESLLEFGRRWQEQVDRMFADLALAPVVALARLLDIRVDHPKLPSLRDLAARFADNWDRLEGVVGLPVVVPEVDRAPARAAMADLEPVLVRCREIPDDSLAEKILQNEAEIDAVRHALAHGTDRMLLRVVGDKRRGKKWGHKSWGKAASWGGSDAKAWASGTVAALEAALDALFDATADDVLRVLAGEVARFTVAAAEERRREGRLQFHDLLVFARHLLRVDATARETLHRRYSRLLIDEFQDTDPIQIELATLIAASVGEVAPGTDWTDIAFDAERLFFVGDPKQSIYRFRRADIGLFLAARDTFGGTSARLSTNFRTVPPVLAWVNHVFDRLMDEEVPGRRPRYEALDGHRADGPGDHRVRLLGSPHPKEEKLRAQELREVEAGAVADAVAGILAAPQSWPVERGGEWHPARPEDIAILVPTRTSLSVLMDALRARDVEFRSETGTLVYETQEIRDLLAILRTVAQPSDAVALVAALRSPILGCGDDDLVTYVRAGGRWDLGAPRPDLDAGHPVRRALAFLDALHAVRWWTAPSELLETVIRERRVMAIALASPRARHLAPDPLPGGPGPALRGVAVGRSRRVRRVGRAAALGDGACPRAAAPRVGRPRGADHDDPRGQGSGVPDHGGVGPDHADQRPARPVLGPLGGRCRRAVGAQGRRHVRLRPSRRHRGRDGRRGEAAAALRRVHAGA